MNDTLDEIIDGWIEKFDAKTEAFQDTPARLFLLYKADFQRSEYAIRAELKSGYYFYFSEYYNFFRLLYATLDRSFTSIAETITHIAFDGQVYEIPVDNRVVIYPNGKKPYFQFFCVAQRPIERFIEPALI